MLAANTPTPVSLERKTMVRQPVLFNGEAFTVTP